VQPDQLNRVNPLALSTNRAGLRLPHFRTYDPASRTYMAMTDDGNPAVSSGGVLETSLADLPPWQQNASPDDFVLRCPFLRASGLGLNSQGGQRKNVHQHLCEKVHAEPPPIPMSPNRTLHSVLTVYDQEHITRICVCSTDADGADWRDVARKALHLDPEHEPDRARRRSTAIYRAPNG